MPKAADLLNQGRSEELWQMCCGFLNLDIRQFMEIQERLLLEQLELLNNCPLGEMIMGGIKPTTIDEFRKVPLTTYKDYSSELVEKREAILPAKPIMWIHSSGWSGDYAYKWVPMTETFAREMSELLYGLGVLSSGQGFGDSSQVPVYPKVVYTVAPRPYISGTMADVLSMQTNIDYMPNYEEAEQMNFEERIKAGFSQGLSKGIDFFFGLSLVLVSVGEKFRESSTKINWKSLLLRPKSLLRLSRGLLRSRLAGRPMMPKDLWKLKGIIGSGVDSGVYKERIMELWGRRPLDFYGCTEGGVIATQVWDYDSMTFVPNLNFLEFIPEDEHFKSQMDPAYQPRTVLLDEVEPGNNYELVITNFHGGAMVRYRLGDMVRITALRNEKMGVNLPQLVFERRVDGLLDFFVVRLTEKNIWQAIETSGIPYEDWTAYKEPGKQCLNLIIELKESYQGNEEEIADLLYKKLVKTGDNGFNRSSADTGLIDMTDFRIKVNLLQKGAFSGYIAQRQAEGADIAHLKPPHINPSDRVLSLLLSGTEAAKPGKEAEEIAV